MWTNEEESRKSETWVLSRTDRVNFKTKKCAKIWFVLREKEGSMKTIFSDSLLQPFSKLSQLQYQIQLVPIECLWKDISDMILLINLL